MSQQFFKLIICRRKTHNEPIFFLFLGHCCNSSSIGCCCCRSLVSSILVAVLQKKRKGFSWKLASFLKTTSLLLDCFHLNVLLAPRDTQEVVYGEKNVPGIYSCFCVSFAVVVGCYFLLILHLFTHVPKSILWTVILYIKGPVAVICLDIVGGLFCLPTVVGWKGSKWG